MANVLERLVAKGRRVQHVRDQREVAFGLADLSTHAELHHRIVKKGAIKTLIHLLTSSRDVEAQRFSSLAIANTSCDEMHRVEIAQQENSLEVLSNYVKNDEADLAARQYCAMALGNLAADPDNHSCIAAVGGIESMVILLKLGAKEQDLESGRYAAFALSNLAANLHYRTKIVEEGAIEPLILIACSDDVNVQQQALAALRGLCISSELRTIVVQSGILDPLVIMSRSEHTEILREVAAALNCLSSVSENKKEVSNRAMLTIILLLLNGDRIVERHACCALANLAEDCEIHERLLDENGLPPLIAMFASQDLNCKGEAARAMANLSANADVHTHLLDEEILQVIIEALSDSEINCQRFSALCLANLATTVSSQMKIVQEGAVPPLILLVRSNNVQLEARRYAALSLANLSAASVNHGIMVKEKALEALFVLSNSPDVLSKYYVACTLANFASNIEVHSVVVQEGGIQPLVDLAYCEDPDVHLNATAALRGLSATGDFKMKIVQEGGLEPLLRLLVSVSKDMILLREVTACLCNLSIGDENKIELANSGVVTPLISLMQHEDMEIASFCCGCLANLAELAYNQEMIVSEGAIKVCIIVMRSRYLEVQREGGRLLANLCACEVKVASDKIIECGGHHLLTSYLLSRDVACQRVGAFGLGNLCTHEKHRVILKDSRVLEPLSTLVRSDDVNLEIQKFAMLAIVNLSHEVKNHSAFVEGRILQVMISLSNSPANDIRQYAALAVANIAKNMDLRQIVTDEGGLEPVLFLARMDSFRVRREVIGALATLSFVDKNKHDICIYGGLNPILQELQLQEVDHVSARLACCAIANLSERIGNMYTIVESGAIPLLVQCLCYSEFKETSETLRALGNLATNFDFGVMIMKQRNVLEKMVSTLQHGARNCRRMAGMTLSNLAANTSFHASIMATNIIDPLMKEFHTSLDPKADSDHECTRFCLLLVANLCTNSANHELFIEEALDLLVKFTNHRDIKCRQNAIITLGNLCFDKNYVKGLSSNGILKAMISFAFPPVETDTTNAQFQAIAALRGLAINDEVRLRLVQLGCCAPLILAAGDECIQTMDIEVRREAAAALFNLALSEDNSILMAQSGIVSALSSLMRVDDTISQVFAVGTLANLAEKGYSVQSRLLRDGCLRPLVGIMNYASPEKETQKEVARCLALFTNELEAHEDIMCEESLQCILKLVAKGGNIPSSRLASLAFANLALSASNHGRLLNVLALQCFAALLSSEDFETWQCVAFALHNVCKNESTHSICSQSNIVSTITHILTLEDDFAKLHACLALRYLSVFKKASVQFVECNGLPGLFQVAKYGNLELKIEATACLRNLSLSDTNKVYILREGGLPILTDLSRSQETRLAHQACGVLANLAEVPANQEEMVSDGVLHHLKFALRSKSNEVNREALRSLCNISSDYSCTHSIANAGLLVPLIRSLSSNEMLCRRFASMAISNIATNRSVQPRLVEEGAIDPLFSIVSQGDGEDDESNRYAFSALSNISSHKSHHSNLLRCDIVQQSLLFLESHDRDLVSSAALCLSNLASNPESHETLKQFNALEKMEPFLNQGRRQLQLRAVSFVRGLSTSTAMRSELVQPTMRTTMLKLATWEDVEVQREVLAALCNLSQTGNIGDTPDSFLEKIEMRHLLSFLCSADDVYRLFGAVVIGNIASEIRLQDAVVNGGAISPLIHAANVADLESQRCIAYTISNLCSDPINRAKICRGGGLLPVISLAWSNDSDDVFAALTTLRALSSCDDIRRFIVECGVLEPLMTICKGHLEGDTRCIKEACQALCWLSLDDENKMTIVQHKIFPSIMPVALSRDASIACTLLRTLSNCSENQPLQPMIMRAMKPTFLDNLFDQDLSNTAPELSRFISNLCSLHDNHKTLINWKFLRHILTLTKTRNVSVLKGATLALLNIATNPKSHEAMLPFGDEIVAALFHACEPKTITTESTKTKRYSCATLGSLLMNNHFHQMILSLGVSELLGKLLNDNDVEVIFIATFTLHQLLKNDQGLTSCKDLTLELIRIIRDMKSCHPIYAVSCLRYLSIDDKIASNIIANGGLDSFHVVAAQADIETLREIATVVCHLSTFSDLRDFIVQSPMFGSILKFCELADSEASRFALGAVANCVESPSVYSYLRNDLEGIVQMLTRTMKKKVLSQKREACRAISNVLSLENAMDIFLNVGGLNSVKTIFRCADGETQYSLALTLRKLASRTSNHNIMMTNGFLRIILHFCNLDHNVGAVRQATTALRDLATNREIKTLITDEGGMKAASLLLDCDDIATSAASAAILHHLSISSLIKFPLYENGILSPLCQQILASDDTDFLYHAGSILANLAEDLNIRELMWEPTIVSALLVLSQANSENVDSQVARCICFMSTSHESERKLRKRMMEITLKLIASKNKQIANDAVNAIGNFAKDEEGQLMLGDLKSFEPIVHLTGVTKENTECGLSSCWALSRFMIPDKNKALCSVNTPLFSHLMAMCGGSNIDGCMFASTALCNIAALKASHSFILQSGGITALLSLLRSNNHNAVLAGLKTLCNLCASTAVRQRIVSENGINILLGLVKERDVLLKEHAILTLCNLAISPQYSKLVAAIGGVEIISDIIINFETKRTQEASVLTLYNISRNEDCHEDLSIRSTLTSLIRLCKNPSHTCRQLAMMTLCNLAANDCTRGHTRKNGALQTAIVMLKDQCSGCRVYASLCLANLTNDPNTQSQAVLHGALPGMIDLLLDEDLIVRRSATLCLVNIAGSASNHSALLSHHALKSMAQMWKTETSSEIKMYISCLYVNLVSNDDIIDIVGGHDGINILMSLSSSEIYHCQCAGISGLRRLAKTSENRERLLHAQVEIILNMNGSIDEVDIQREVAGCLQTLSTDPLHRKTISYHCLPVLRSLLSSTDPDTLESAAATIAYLAESDEYRKEVIYTIPILDLTPLLQNTHVQVYREASRAISNILSSCETHNSFTSNGLSALLCLCQDIDKECQYNASLACRKIVVSKISHPQIMGQISGLMTLANCEQMETRNLALTVLRDLSANACNRRTLLEKSAAHVLIPLLDHRDLSTKTLATATLRHLSSDHELQRMIMTGDIIIKAASSILGASDNLLSQLAGLLANLSEEDDNRCDMVQMGVVPALTVLSRAHSAKILVDVSRALANLAANVEKQFDIHQQGGLACLMSIANRTKDESCQRFVSMTIQLLCMNANVRKAIIKENGLGQFLSLSFQKTLEYKICAAMSLYLLSSDEENRSYLAQEALDPLLELCKVHTLDARRKAMCALANLADSLDAHDALVKTNAVKIIGEIAESCIDSITVRELTRFLASLSINDTAKDQILNNEILPKLIKFSRRTDTATQRYSSLAICNLTLHTKEKKNLIQQDGLLRILAFLAKCSDLEVERCSILSIAALSLGTEVCCKERIANSGALLTVLKALKYPDMKMKQCSSLALNSLVLSTTSTIKLKVKEMEEDFPALFSLLEAKDDECIHNGVYAMGSMVESTEVRQSLIGLGCMKAIVKILPSASIKTKRACGYVFSVLAEYREHHADLSDSGALQSVVDLAGLVDLECQLYGAFALVFLATNAEFQVPLVKMGAVRYLVTMMSTESEHRHYAGLALLKLADNFENHIQIAEEGGIEALLKLGRSKVADDEMQYKSAMTVNKLAANAIKRLPTQSRSGDIGKAVSNFSQKSKSPKKGSSNLK